MTTPELIYQDFRCLQPASRRLYWELAFEYPLLILLVPTLVYFTGQWLGFALGLLGVAAVAALFSTSMRLVLVGLVVALGLCVCVKQLNLAGTGFLLGVGAGCLFWRSSKVNNVRSHRFEAERQLRKFGRLAEDNPYKYVGYETCKATTKLTFQRPDLEIGKDPHPITISVSCDHPEERMMRNLCKPGDLLEIKPWLPAKFIEKQDWENIYYVRLQRVVQPPATPPAPEGEEAVAS